MSDRPKPPIHERIAHETKEGRIPVRGGEIWYKVAGINRQGVPLMVLHGGPGASHDYLEPMEALANERPVVFYDQLGCGNSDKPENIALWTVKRYVDEVSRLRGALGLKAVHIMGQSWGTSLAVDYVLGKPEGVVSLVLSGPLLSASRWIEDQKAHIAELPADLRQTIRTCEDTGAFGSPEYQDAVMAYYKRHVCRLDPWPECLNRSFEKLNFAVYEYMWGPSEFTVTGALKNYERVDRLNAITVPVLLTCGSHDEAPPLTTRYYHENLPGSEVHVFEDASHEHHLEKQAEYMTVVRDFLYGEEKIWARS